MYMLCDHRAFMSPESCSKALIKYSWQTVHIPLWQSRPYQPRACFLFRLSIRVDPFLRWPAPKSFSSTHRFQLGKILSANLYSSRRYNIQHVVVKTGIWGHYEGSNKSIYRRDGKWSKPTQQPLQHEVMNQSFQTDMRTLWGRFRRVYIGKTGNKGKPGPQPLQHESMN